MKLLGKYIITGADSPHPNPRMPHDTLAQAIHQAGVMIQNREFRQSGALIWTPCKIVRFRQLPVDVIDVAEPVIDRTERCGCGRPLHNGHHF